MKKLWLLCLLFSISLSFGEDSTTPITQDSSQADISQPEEVIKQEDAASQPGRLQILEDKLRSMETYKINNLEMRLKNLESPPVESDLNKGILTPLAEGKISTWGNKAGFGIGASSISGNAALGLEINLPKIPLPQMERPLTYEGLLGIGVGADLWLNLGTSDKDEWGLLTYIRISGGSLVFTNYMRMYASLEPLAIIGYTAPGQAKSDIHMGLRAIFGTEIYASRHYNLFAEIGILKTNSLDGSSKDTGFTPSIKGGPRFWF